MKINSIFKDRLYSLPSASRITSTESKIIKKILSSSKCDINIDKLSLVCVEEDYDFYQINSGNKIYELKFSLDHKSEKFNREIKNVKTSKSLYTSKYLDNGTIKVGDKVSYLIAESFRSESLFDYGRSELTTDLDLFCECYCDFALFGNYRITQTTLSKRFLEESVLSSVFDKDQQKHIENHSDYVRCDLIINNLKSDIEQLLKKLPKKYTGNIIGDFGKNSIYVGEGSFLFKDLRYGCKGHVYSDIANAVLFFGLDKKIENSLISNISSRMSIPVDRDLYDAFYEVELRKKALFYLIQYLKEVYLYESSRIEVIVSLIDSFSQSYERLCKIPIFREHRHFISMNITEPILEGNPKD